MLLALWMLLHRPRPTWAMPVFRPDLTHVERMPVIRPNLAVVERMPVFKPPTR